MKNKYLFRFIVAMAVFGTIGVFRRFVPLDSGLICMSRGIIGGVFILVYLKCKGRPFSFSHMGKKIWFPILVGAVMGFNWLTLFESYNYTSVATATLCYYMQPFFLILLSPLFKEKITLPKLICVIVAFGGMILVSGILQTGFTGTDDLKGILFGLGSAVLYAFVISMNKLMKGYDSYEKTAVQLLSAAAAVVPYLIARGVFTSQETALGCTPLSLSVLALIAIVHTGIMYIWYFSSIEHLKIQQIAILSFIDPVVAVLLSWIVLKETMNLSTAIGAVLIIGSAIVSETVLGQQEQPETS